MKLFEGFGYLEKKSKNQQTPKDKSYFEAKLIPLLTRTTNPNCTSQLMVHLSCR